MSLFKHLGHLLGVSLLIYSVTPVWASQEADVFLGKRTDFTMVGKKPGGANDGYLAEHTEQGKVYMLKISTGYLNQVSAGADDAHISEAIATRLFKKILGPTFAPNTYLVHETGGSRGNATVFASEWKQGAVPLRLSPFWHDPSGAGSAGQDAASIQLHKINTLAKILNVVDQKDEHLMYLEGCYFIVDSEATFENSDLTRAKSLAAAKGLLIDPQSPQKQAIESTILAIARLSDEDILEILQPFAKASKQISTIKRNIWRTRNLMQKLAQPANDAM